MVMVLIVAAAVAVASVIASDQDFIVELECR
jgi:hypothetical protein